MEGCIQIEMIVHLSDSTSGSFLCELFGMQILWDIYVLNSH